MENKTDTVTDFKRTKQSLNDAYNQFNNAIGEKSIDMSIHRICACEKELELLMGKGVEQ